MAYKRNLLSAALASTLIAMASGATAQTSQVDPRAAPNDEESDTAARGDDEATRLDSLIVTGIRRGIENAIETKQSSSSIVEAISAEDIGKLPDVSIADSIARLPGLTAQRDRGRAQEIHIRGLAGDFSTTLLNGREQVSLGNNRGVEFDQYPSELVNQVVVYKTPDASLIGQGLSGTVDLQTVRPLSFADRVIAINARGDMSKLEDDKAYGNRYSLSYIDQFADRTLGLALGYARLNNPAQGNQFESWGYPDGRLGGGKLYDFENDNTRDGFMAALEYQPNDRYSSIFDLYYSRFDKEEFKRGMEFGLAWGDNVQMSNPVTSPLGTVVESTWSNFRPIIRNDFNGAKDDLFAAGWNHKFKFSDDWSVNVDLSTSKARRRERILETYATLASGLSDTVTTRFNPEGYYDFDFGLDYSNPSILRLTDPGGWGGDRAQAGYLKDFEVEDKLDSLRVDFERSFERGAISSVDFGFNYADRSKSRSSDESTLCLTAACTDNVQVAIPTQYVTCPTTVFGGAQIVNLDVRRMLAGGVYILNPKTDPDISNKNWEVEEQLFTGYVQANIDADLGAIPLRGNFGLQLIDVDQSSSGFATYAGNQVGDAFAGGDSYQHYLPSLNLAATLPAEQVVRLGLGRQVARPRMDQMRANAGYGINRERGIWSGGGGNPELRPWEANAMDLSYEKYFGGRGYFSAAYFHKDLRTYVYDQVVPFDFSGLAIPPGTLPADVPTSPIGEFTRPANGEGGTLKGFEYALSVPFDMFWSPLEGFGMQASYTNSSTSIAPDGPGSETPLPGFSKYTSNITLYYERYGFSTRASRRSRSKFLGEVQGFGGDRERIFFEGEAVVDLQIGYTFQRGLLENLSLIFQVNNLTDEPFRSTYDEIADRPRQYFEYGRNYLLGFSYRF
jgi:iron complex outermembrane recepter protein